jgi:hypothetical protein
MKRFAILLLVAAACSACLRSTTVISLKPDGSGTIVQETGMTAQAVAMLKSMQASGGNQGNAPKELFGEQEARKAADTMGVKFVGGEPIKGQLEGYRARFAFDDIRQIKMQLSQDPTADLAKGATADPPFGFEFEKGAAASRLIIKMPDLKSPAGSMGLPAEGANPEQMQQAMAMMKVMMAGMFVDVSLDVDGRIVKTDAPYVQGSRVTLMQIDFDKLLADEGSLMKLQKATDIKSLAGVPGLKVLTNPKVTVEFAK